MLRLLVEKSELWVFKKKGDGKKEKTNEEDEGAPPDKPVLQVCYHYLFILMHCVSQ